MGRLPASLDGVALSRRCKLTRTQKVMVCVAVIASLLRTIPAGPALASPPPATSLCVGGEKALFSCPIRGKVVSVCGISNGKSVYRFGRPGRIELQSHDLHKAEQGASGGGEDQINFTANGYRYIVYAQTVRTGFGSDGHNDPDFISGLVVQKDGRKVMAAVCGGGGGQTIDWTADHFMPRGDFVDH